MPRYVLLRHQCPLDYEKPSHWDFMVEQGEVLLTWELHDLPDLWGEALALPASDSATVPAIRLADHRTAYLDYEGPLSKNRGSVTRHDRGECAIIEQDDSQHVINLISGKLTGSLKLTYKSSSWRLTASTVVMS